MADSVVSARLRIDGVDQIFSTLTRFKSELTSLAGTKAKVDIDDSAALTKIAATEAAMKRLASSPAAKFKVMADTSQAEAQISAFEGRVKSVSAAQVKITPQVDTAEAEGRIAGLAAKMKDLLVMGAGQGLGMSAVSGIAGIFKAGADAAVGFNAMMEQANIGFTTMLGSAAKAKAFLDDLKYFAATTPFEIKDLVPAAQKLMAMGFAAKDVVPTLRAVGDAVAALGGNKEILDRVTLAMGQMLAAGKVNAQDMRQLAEAGIPAWDMLAKAIGKTTAETMKLAENGAIAGQTGVDALIAGMEERFGGMMDKQSHTLLGALSNVKDIFNQRLAGAATDFFNTVSAGMNKLADGLMSGKFDRLFQDMANGFTLAAHVVGILADALGKVPLPAVEGIAKIMLLVGGFKALQAVGGFVVGSIGELVGSIARSIAALTGESAALAENSAAQTTNASARQRNAAAAGEGAAASRMSGMGAGMGAGLAGLAGELAIPLVVYMAAKSVVLDPIDRAITDAIAQDKTKWASQTVDMTLAAIRVNELNPNQAKESLQAQRDAIEKAISEVPKGKWHVQANNPSSWLEWAMGGGQDDPNAGYSEQEQKIVDQYKAALTRVDSQLANYTPEAQSKAMTAAKDALAQQKDAIISDLEHGRIDVEEAKRELMRTAIQDLPMDNKSAYDSAITDSSADDDKRLAEAKRVMTQSLLDEQDFQRKRALLLKLGANDEDITAGFKGGDKVIEKRLTVLEDTSVKAAQEDIKNLNKAFDDLASATDKIDLSTPLGSLEKALPSLKSASDELALIGAAKFDNLNQLITIGQGLADFEKNAKSASGALDAFSEVSAHTDGYIKQLQTLKSNLEEAYKTIQAKPRSTWTDDEKQLVAGYDTAVKGLDKDIGTLSSHKVPDILAELRNAPDFVALDNQFRAFVEQYGGAEGLRVKIEMDVDDLKARKSIDQFLGMLKNPKDTRIDVLVAGDDKAQAALDRLRAGEDGIQQQKDILIVAKASGIDKIEELQMLVNGLPTSKNINVSVTRSGGLDIPTGTPSGGGAIGPYADGGYVTSDLAIVGDTKSGDMSAAEVVDFKHNRVFSHEDSVRMGLLHGGLRKFAGGDGGGGAGAGRKNYLDPTDSGHDAGVYGSANVGGATQSIQSATAATKELHTALIDVSAEAAKVVATFATMHASDISSTVSQFGQLAGILEKVAQAKLGPNATQEQKDAASAGALKQSLDFTVAWGQALTDIRTQNGHLAESIEKVKTTAGPLADNYVRQLSIMDNIARIAGTINDLTAQRKSIEDAHNQTLQDRAETDRASERQHTIQQRTQQDFDTARQRQHDAINRADTDADTTRQRSQEREQWGIEDSRTAIQRKWKVEADAIAASAKAREVARQAEQRGIADQTNAENDAWTARSRQLEDIRRQAEFSGTQAKQDLVTAQQTREDSHRLANEGMDARGQLLSASARGGSTNEAAAAAAASLADLKDQQATADENFTKATDANKVLQDAEDKKQAQLMYDLETQNLAETRAHEDRLKAIDQTNLAETRAYEDETNRLNDEAVVRQAQHDLLSQQWQDEDTARSRSHTLEQEAIDDERLARSRMWDDEQQRIDDARLASDRKAEDDKFNLETVRLAEDQKYQASLKSIDAEIAAQDVLKKAEEEKLKAAQDVAGWWSQIYDKAGASADAILTAFTEIADSANVVIQAAQQAAYDASVVGLSTANGVPYSQFPAPKKYATGTSFFGGGAAYTDEQGGEAKVYPTGTMIIPADQTARMLKHQPVAGTTGDITVNIYQQPGEDAEALAARIKQVIKELQDESAATTYRETVGVRHGATGGVR